MRRIPSLTVDEVQERIDAVPRVSLAHLPTPLNWIFTATQGSTVAGLQGFAGLLDYCQDGRVPEGDRVVFIHTGGLPALFSYSEDLLAGVHS